MATGSPSEAEMCDLGVPQPFSQLVKTPPFTTSPTELRNHYRTVPITATNAQCSALNAMTGEAHCTAVEGVFFSKRTCGESFSFLPLLLSLPQKEISNSKAPVAVFGPCTQMLHLLLLIHEIRGNITCVAFRGAPVENGRSARLKGREAKCDSRSLTNEKEIKREIMSADIQVEMRTVVMSQFNKA